MKRQTLLKLKQLRKSHYLKLKDLAFILGINTASLSRFEAGKTQNSKALLGYHILFDLSIQESVGSLFENGYKELVNRCFELLERLDSTSDAHHNMYRTEGVDKIIARLTKFEESYAG